MQSEEFKKKLSLLPTSPGCYLYKDKEESIIYVGKAKNLKRRVNSYFNRVQTGKTKALIDNIVSFEYIVTNSEIESLILEINLIKKYNPKYNILLKDDKTYPYIALSTNPYPSLKIIRSKNRKKIKDKLFGPYPNVVSAKETVNLINRIYPLKKCNNLQKDVCLYYHINECLGYCKYKIEQEQIDKMVKEITNILNGDYKLITKKLDEEMQVAANNLNYEKAIELRNKIDSIKKTINKQIIVSNIKYNFDVFGYYEQDNFLTITTLIIRDGLITGEISKVIDNYVDVEDIYLRYIIDFYDKFQAPKQIVVNDLKDKELLEKYLDIQLLIPQKGDIKKILNMANLNAEISSKEKIEMLKKNDNERIKAINKLQELLNLEKLKRIELFDNSHLFGTYYVGAMVVFDDFIANKKEYRKYKVSTEVKDDLQAMKEVIYRRYYRVLVDKLTKPDLIIVDGGETQVKVAKEIIDNLNLDIKVIGLKKDNHHRTSSIIDSDLNEIVLPKDNKLFLYLTKMQDEVHRFAISYHRDIKSKGSLESILDNVEQIGPKRRKELLKKFKTIGKLKEASLTELTEIIPQKVAIDLQNYLKDLTN